MGFFELKPVVVLAGTNTIPEQACQVFFYGDYHYCGDAGGDYVWCCPGEIQ